MPSCLLAVDTATEICGVALAVEGAVVTELILNNRVTHTRSVMAAIDTVLTMAGMDIDAVDAYAVSRGPGGFTGLRIGIGTVKGLALATKKPMVGISSLEVLAHQAPDDVEYVCPIIDARRKEVYWRLYRCDRDGLAPVSDAQVGSVADLAEKIDHPCYFIGNGVAPYQSELTQQLKLPAHWANSASNGMRPMVLAQLAWNRFTNGTVDDIRNFTPTYLRKSDAELAREAKKS